MFTETTSSSDGALLELQKELIRYKENESTSAHYISEMEARLSKYDEDIETLRRDMSKLERELADSRERCRTMDALVETLRAEREAERKDREEWVKVLEAREKRVEALEVQMKEVERDRAFLASERERLGGVVGGVEKARRSLEMEVEDTGTPFMTPATEVGEMGLFRGEVNGTNGVNRNGGEGERQAAAIDELQKKHAATLAELNTVNTRYQDALHDISDLYAQINEIKLQGGVEKAGGETNGVQVETNGETNGVHPDTNTSTDTTPPTRSPPTPTQRRRAGSRAAAAVGLESPSGTSARRLFFRHAASSESLHARSQLQSVSLSQELSSARSPKSSWSANENYNQGAGLNGESALGMKGMGHRPQLSLQLPSERSADDLEKEIKSLQAVSQARFL